MASTLFSINSEQVDGLISGLAMKIAEPNLVAAWIGITLGFLGGAIMGLSFRDENWLGGYSSFKRRLYRLAHISFFGLGFVNLAFYLTSPALGTESVVLVIASRAFLLGAVSMPICALILAHKPGALPLFSIPVGSLLVGSCLTVSRLLSWPAW